MLILKTDRMSVPGNKCIIPAHFSGGNRLARRWTILIWFFIGYWILKRGCIFIPAPFLFLPCKPGTWQKISNPFCRFCPTICNNSHSVKKSLTYWNPGLGSLRPIRIFLMIFATKQNGKASGRLPFLITWPDRWNESGCGWLRTYKNEQGLCIQGKADTTTLIVE